MRGTKTLIVSIVVLIAALAAYVFLRPGSVGPKIRLIGEAYAPLDALDKIKGEFEKSTGIQVEIVQKDHESVVAEIDQELSSGQVTYDIILEPHRLLGKRVEKGQVLPLEAFLKDPTLHDPSFDPERDLVAKWWHETGWYNGKLYGLPFTNLTMYVVYRKDLLEDPRERIAFRKAYGREIAPPRTWREYVDLARFFNRPSKGLSGTYIQGQQHIALWYEWLNFAYSFGGNILDAKSGNQYGDIVVNSPENLKATEQYVDLIQYSPRETLNYNWDDALSALQQGRVFMGILWHDQTPLLEDPSTSKVAGKLGYALIPSATGKPASQLEGWTYLIPTKSPHPKEAYRFMEWAMRKNVQIEQTLHGGASALKETYRDPRVMKIPYVPTYLESLPIAVAKPTIPESSEITEIMERNLSQIVTRRVTPQKGLDAMAVQIEQALGGKAKLRYPLAH